MKESSPSIPRTIETDQMSMRLEPRQVLLMDSLWVVRLPKNLRCDALQQGETGFSRIKYVTVSKIAYDQNLHSPKVFFSWALVLVEMVTFETIWRFAKGVAQCCNSSVCYK